MAGNTRNVTRRQEAAIAALLSSASISEASKTAGIAERTLYRWLKIDSFNAAYQDARREVVLRTVGTIQAAMVQAVETLRCVMIDDKSPPSAKVSAARVIIETGMKAYELGDLEERIAALESTLAA
jgi:hypothetical protein